MSSLNLKVSQRMLCPLALLIGALFLTTACSHSGGDSERPNLAQATPYRDRAVPLSEISSDQCLNLQTYYQALLSLAPDVQARKITTEFSTTAIQNHPKFTPHFLARVAAGNFAVEDRAVASLPELGPMQQTGCETVVFQGAGHQNVYKITEFTKDSLTLKNEWNGEKTIKWISPTSLSIVQTDMIASDLCSDDAMMQIHVTTSYNWASNALASVTLPGNAIKSEFLKQVSDAKAFSLESLFTTAPPAVPSPAPAPEEPANPPDVGGTGVPASGEKLLLVDKLKELTNQQGRPDLGICD